MHLERLATWYIKLRRRADAQWALPLLRESLQAALRVDPDALEERALLSHAATLDKRTDARRRADMTQLGRAVERFRRGARAGIQAWLRENRIATAANGEDLLVAVAREVGETAAAFTTPLLLPAAALLAILLLSRRG